jgi:hypothetical protein
MFFQKNDSQEAFEHLNNFEINLEKNLHRLSHKQNLMHIFLLETGRVKL